MLNVEKENKNKNLFEKIINLIKDFFQKNNTISTIVIIVCIAYIISKIISIFKVNVNLSF